MAQTQDYWFKVPSVITEDYVTNTVGINNDNPQHTLDVSGNVNANNLIVDETIYTNNIAVTSNITAKYVEGEIVNAGSNLLWNNYSLYDPCPVDDGSWDIIPFKEDLGMIHYSWLRRPTSAENIFEDLYNIADLGLDLVGIVAAVSAFLAGQSFDVALASAMGASMAGALAGEAGQEALDAIKDAFEDMFDEDTGSNTQIYMSWQNVKKKPIFVQQSSGNVAVRGDMYVHADKCLFVGSTNNFSYDGNSNLTLASTANVSKLLDFGNKEGFFKKINTDNLVLGSSSLKTLNSNNYILFNPSNIDINSNYFKYNSNGGELQTNEIYCERLYDSYTKSNTYKSGLSFWGAYNQMRFANSNNVYNTLTQDITGLKYSFTSNGVTSQKMALDSNGDITLQGNLYTSNEFLISTSNVSTLWQNGKSYDINANLIMDYQILSYSQSLTDQQYPQSNIDLNLFQVSADGLLLHTPKLFGSNEIISIQNPANPLGSNITLSNYTRLEYSLSNGLIYGLAYSNAGLSQFDLLRYRIDEGLGTYDTESSTLIPLVNQFGTIGRNGFEVYKNGEMKTNKRVQIGSIDIRSNNDIYHGNKKLYDGTLKVFLASAIDFSTSTEFIAPSFATPETPPNVYLDALLL